MEPIMEEEPTDLDWVACRILGPALLDHNMRATIVPRALRRPARRRRACVCDRSLRTGWSTQPARQPRASADRR